MLYSFLENLNVYSITDARLIGKPIGICIFKETFTCGYIVLSNAENNILAYSDIYSCKDVITIKSSYVLMRISAIEHCFFIKPGTIVVDVDGSLFDELEDIEISAKSGFLICKSKKIRFNKIVSASDTLIFVSTNSRPANQQFLTRKTAMSDLKNKTPNLITPLIIEPRGHSNEVLLSATPEYKKPDLLEITNNYSFLIGRRVEKEITDLTRTFVIKEGTIITSKLIALAKKAGKLTDLTINSSK
ncbi:MAG: hypothetical protein LBF12_02115 [Christensenellaceae bacterium]|jgi:hypothetical protein|nr:hypothetical protein [Christensenellaceae bacterium]